jgi:hypothetical protein
MTPEWFAIALSAAAAAAEIATAPGAQLSANAQNLRAMVVSPADMIHGVAPAAARGDLAAGAVKALLDGTPKRLIDPLTGVTLAGGSAAPAGGSNGKP